MNGASDIRVALVEDDPVIRETIAHLLRLEKGFDLMAIFANGEDAVAGMPREAVDIVLMDISMPGMTGIDCMRELRGDMPATQFLMYTMHDDDHRVFEALKGGATGYILKSSSPDQIIEAIKELHHGGAPMSTAVARRVVAHFRPVQQPGAKGESPLSEREHAVLVLLSQGLLYKEIADRLGLTIGTVKQHIHRMYGKMHVQNRVEAVNKFYGR